MLTYLVPPDISENLFQQRLLDGTLQVSTGGEVFLRTTAAEDWMNPNEAQPKRLKSLLLPALEEVLLITPASHLVNSVKNDGPELLNNQIAQGQQLRLV